jgi:hypothetical protein
MARPLRIERVGGWYHATARGNERRNIFRDDTDRLHFFHCIVEDDHGWQDVARYVHLNPVRLGRLGLGKSQQKASRAGRVRPPAPEVVSERLRTLREYRWSSYRGYAGYCAPLACMG